MLILSKTHFNEMASHAESTFPNECCGGMIGSFQDDKKYVMQVLPIQNNWVDTHDETKAKRFMISSDDYRFLEETATKHQCVLLGFYHSHPNQSAIPSKTDAAFAWPFFSYPIISVIDGVATDILSYGFNADTQSFFSESISIQPSSI